MSSLLGHGLAGLAVYKAVEGPAQLPTGWRGVVFAVGLAAVPDLDVLARIALPQVFAHRGPTHSLLFAAGLALLAAFLVRRWQWRDAVRAWPALALVCAVHPLLDYLMGRGPGVPFLWPWSDEVYLSPIPLLPTAYYAKSLAGLLGLFQHRQTLVGMGLEVIIFLPLVFLSTWAGAIKPPGRAMAFALAMLSLSAVGVYLTLMMCK